MAAEILLVDDNFVQAATRKAILARLHRSISLASSAREALTMLSQPGHMNAIRIVITDHLMPGMNGPEFVAILRRTIPDVPVIVLSGLADAEVEYTGLDIVFRVKPFLPEEFIALVQSLLEHEPLSRTA